MRLNEILFPTDFSFASEAAGRIAREIAVRADARLHVLHVVPPATDPSLPAQSGAQVARRLADGLRSETVLGTHGRTGISQAILGSVAETVVRLAPCLVLTVPASLLAERSAVPGAALAAAVFPRPCLVCGKASDDLICEGCRTRIRGEALEQKRAAERPGHRGLPV